MLPGRPCPLSFRRLGNPETGRIGCCVVSAPTYTSTCVCFLAWTMQTQVSVLTPSSPCKHSFLICKTEGLVWICLTSPVHSGSLFHPDFFFGSCFPSCHLLLWSEPSLVAGTGIGLGPRDVDLRSLPSQSAEGGAQVTQVRMPSRKFER